MPKVGSLAASTSKSLSSTLPASRTSGAGKEVRSPSWTIVIERSHHSLPLLVQKARSQRTADTSASTSRPTTPHPTTTTTTAATTATTAVAAGDSENIVEKLRAENAELVRLCSLIGQLAGEVWYWR